MAGQLAQFGGSLLAILALAWLARRLGLGGDSRIRDAAHLRELAEDALYGFEPVEIALDKDGAGALARDDGGRVMLLRRHGAHFAARLLDGNATARVDGHVLVVAVGERRFGEARLDLGAQTAAWAARLARL